MKLVTKKQENMLARLPNFVKGRQANINQLENYQYMIWLCDNFSLKIKLASQGIFKFGAIISMNTCYFSK